MEVSFVFGPGGYFWLGEVRLTLFPEWALMALNTDLCKNQTQMDASQYHDSESIVFLLIKGSQAAAVRRKCLTQRSGISPRAGFQWTMSEGLLTHTSSCHLWDFLFSVSILSVAIFSTLCYLYGCNNNLKKDCPCDTRIWKLPIPIYRSSKQFLVTPDLVCNNKTTENIVESQWQW